MSFFEAILHNDLPSVQKYIEDGADINLFTPDDEPRYHPSWLLGNTPLVLAIKRGYFEIAEYLIDAGANVEQGADFSPLQVAVRYNQPTCLSLLLKNNALVSMTYGHWTALKLAIMMIHEGGYSVLNAPLDPEDPMSVSCLSIPNINNYVDMIKMIVEQHEIKGIFIADRTRVHPLVLQARAQIQAEQQSLLEYTTSQDILFQYSSAFEFSEIDGILKTYIGVKLDLN